ncbi:hypothetical protein [Clostridium ljungdahlii]|uniref:hypothetical protein n=1 Tax=Clostridium ljungdahlii TaxID=1538 RepID=UPI0007BF1833|nr:hypothetical protein [Clostridium ljungdahlii]
MPGLRTGITVRTKLASIVQGGSLFPLLANMYLHYTLYLWFAKVLSKRCKGECYITRYADDSIEKNRNLPLSIIWQNY